MIVEQPTFIIMYLIACPSLPQRIRHTDSAAKVKKNSRLQSCGKHQKGSYTLLYARMMRAHIGSCCISFMWPTCLQSSVCLYACLLFLLWSSCCPRQQEYAGLSSVVHLKGKALSPGPTSLRPSPPGKKIRHLRSTAI